MKTTLIQRLAGNDKLRYLFGGIISFIITSNNIFLLADSTRENIVTERITNEYNYMNILEKKIHDLIIQGHSVDEIITILSNGHGHFRNNQELIIKIYKLLSEQGSKPNNNGTTILINNKESEEFYAQMNSLTRMAKRILILKIIIVTGITAGLLYLLYRLLKTNQSTNEDINEEDNDHHEDLDILRIEALHERLSATPEASNDGQEQEAVGQGAIDDRQEIIGDEHHHHVNVITHGQASLLTELRASVMQQIEHARSIGLEPAIVLPAHTPTTNNPIFSMNTTGQFAYAENLGLLQRPQVQFIRGHRIFLIPNDDDNYSHRVTMSMSHLNRPRRDYFS